MKNNHFDSDTAETYDLLSKKEKWIELVTHFRLSLYNKGVACGEKTILEKMTEEYIRSLPSISTISKILGEQCLTHGRTGYYEEDYDNSNSCPMKDII
jgi:hypothetical protein